MLLLLKVSIWTALSTLIKIGAGLLMVKVLALNFGPSGLGQASSFRQLVTMLGVLSGAGIFNGITKLVAENSQQQRLRAVVGTGSSIVLGFSLLLMLFCVLTARPLSIAFFGHDRFRNLIIFLAFIQLGIAYANLGLAVLQGYRDLAGNALAISCGNILGVTTFLLGYQIGGYQGSLLGLALMPTMTLLPVLVILSRRLPLTFLQPIWHSGYAKQLSKFTIMALMTAITMPVAYLVMRQLLAYHYGWEAVGIWQGVSSISDAYLQFITASFTIYLLPTLAQLNDKRAVAQEISRSLTFVLSTATMLSLTVWLLREELINLLLSSQFLAINSLLFWQLMGDVLKVGAYVFGYLVVARVSLRLYILAELSQFTLLTGFSQWLIPCYGTLGAIQAYLATYLVYFILCVALFLLYIRIK
ncbi:lipid III flippase WzxE [Candidatus Palibaumannia cicadellinicola]|uniref:Lipid III flippase n=1 Tax=Candidatus Palibaumannia cicadellinicola TaxID=186490 RepID=A0A088MXR4_9GAMM|nr:lipid III flippase WzxE [Candidatus Baumannia cicadellinicola]AIN47092.1 lipid III flippase [Candidatus Baumannia cicadellinicola]